MQIRLKPDSPARTMLNAGRGATQARWPACWSKAEVSVRRVRTGGASAAASVRARGAARCLAASTRGPRQRAPCRSSSEIAGEMGVVKHVQRLAGALGQLARNRPEAFVERCLASAHGRFSTIRRAATRAGPAMHGADRQSRQAEHQHELEVARLQAVVAGSPTAGGEARRFPSSWRRACRGAGGSRRRRSHPTG